MDKNKIEISCQDEHEYVFCVQIVTPVSKDDVRSLMHVPENLEAAILRVRRIVRGFVSEI